MATYTHMPNYDIRNDGAGPYAVFYCDVCNREFRSQPDIAGSIKQDIGRSAVSSLLRKVPLVGSSVADNVVGEDPRYSYKMTPAQIDSAWQQVQVHFRECPTCQRIVCLSDFDTQSGFCQEDSPRTDEIAESRGAQAGAAIKGFAAAFGLGNVLDNVPKAAEAASRGMEGMAHCPKDGTLAAPGTKFCPECGTPMVSRPRPSAPSAAPKPAAKVLPQLRQKNGSRAPGNCPNCGAPVKGAKFCPECGTKIG